MNSIIQNFIEDGYIDKEAAQRLEGFDELIKEAGILDSLKGWGSTLAKSIGPSAAGTALALYASDYLTNKSHAKQLEDEFASTQASFGSVAANDPQISENRERALSRFHEIAKFSPTVASTPGVVGPLLKRTMDTGLSEDDVQKLVSIESGVKASARPKTQPTSAKLVERAIPSMFENTAREFQRLNQQGGGSGGASGSQGPSSPSSPSNPSSDNSATAELRGPQLVKILQMISQKQGGKISPEVDRIMETKDVNEKMNKFRDFIQANPRFLQDKANELGLSSEFSNIVKQGSASLDNLFENIPMEKKAAILADQYNLIKTAAPKKILDKMLPSLMGLGAAALFGGTMGLVEHGVDYARTQKSNAAIDESWKQTSSKLKKMNEESLGISSGVDYSDKDTQRKAQEAFKVLVDVAPSLAANSSVAAPFVNRVVQQEGDITPDSVKMLSDIQKNLNTTKAYRSPFSDSPTAQGFGRGFEGAGGGEFMKGVAKSVIPKD